MMGRQSGQMSMLVLDFTELIPDHHLLRKISQAISFDFIYEILKPYYPANGRPSVDPVSMFKMLLVGYLYGIKSERRLVQEVQLNIAYRWFCGFELADKIPDHSTFSKTRLRKWDESQLFQQVFLEIIRRCVKNGLIDGKELAADGTYLPANVSKDSWIDTEIETELSMQSYLDRLDEELSQQPGFKKPPAKMVKKCRTTSKTDPDSGCINHGKKSGIGSWLRYRYRSSWSGVAGHHRIHSRNPVFQFSGKVWFLLSAPRRCISLSGRCQACLPAVELQSNDRKILALLSSAGGYLQTLQAKRYLLSANGHSAQNSWKQLLLCPSRFRGQ